MYTYEAIVRSVYDGDTIRADIDLGFGVWKMNEQIRLLDINAPEVRGDNKIAGIASRDYLRELILGKEIILETEKDHQGKYGRFLGRIMITHEGTFMCVNDYLVQMGFAIYQDY